MTTSKQILADAIVRGTRRKKELLRESGGLLSAREAARLLGTTIRGVQAKRSLVAIRMDNGGTGYPAFQFESKSILAGVGAVLQVIGVNEPWMRLNFIFMHSDELGGKRPIDAIREGSVEAVILAAAHFGDHGAS